MDISTLLGVVVGLLVVGVGLVSGGDLSAYLGVDSAVSLVIVLGGAVGAVMVGYPKEKSFKLMKVMMSTIKTPELNSVDTIRTLVSFSEKARREGLLSLEEDAADLPDQFMKKGVQLIVDGTDPDLLRDMMEIEIDLIDGDLSQDQKMMEAAGAYAPAFGMIGTVLGLIAMLGALNNPDALGPAMAKALITTLYGAIIANGFLLPMGEKLALRKEILLMHKRMILEGILSIQAGDNPRLLEEKLKTFLSDADKKAYDASTATPE
ncbi:MAG TPA: motility protein A [Thermotogota bacterium]|nr:motility protein A [Thermotogota bacterium]HRW92662.1 motility protein A [Thermotogota bacterium]